MRAIGMVLALVAATACEPERVELEIGQRGPFHESEDLYDPMNLERFDLEVPAASMDALRAAPREWAGATLVHRGQRYDVGVRLKGEASFRPIDDKPAFKIKLAADQTIGGVRRMTWNNAVQDMTFLGERLSYELAAAAGVPAPRATSCLVHLNGAFYGVYTHVEAPDEAFLGRWFASTEGNLYEEGGRDLVPGAEAAFDLETNEGADDRSDLAALIAALDRATPETFGAELAPHLDLDEVARFAAVEALANQYDGYTYGDGPRNNFRLYHDPATGLFHFVPSGMDQTMQPGSAPELTSEWVPPVEDVDAREVVGLVMTKCLAAPDCRERHGRALADVADLFEARLPALAVAWSDQIRADVRADTRKPADDATTEIAWQRQREFLATRAAAVRF
jgi:hypothetical protein